MRQVLYLWTEGSCFIGVRMTFTALVGAQRKHSRSPFVSFSLGNYMLKLE
jgi:hypothetical protein